MLETALPDLLVVAMHLGEVLVLEPIDEVLEEVVDGDDGLIGELRQVQDEGLIIRHEGIPHSGARRRRISAPRRW